MPDKPAKVGSCTDSITLSELSRTYRTVLKTAVTEVEFIGDRLRLYASCQGVLARIAEKNCSDSRCCSGKGATIKLDESLM